MKTSKQKRFAAIFAGMLCISCLTAPFSATAETADTAGENDTLAAAEELPLNTAVSGEISAKGDMDYYKITLPEDVSVGKGWSTYEMMKVADCVITDYSAASLEVSLLNKPVYLYLYDYDAYTDAQGLNIDLWKAFPHAAFRTAAEVAQAVQREDYDWAALQVYRETYIQTAQEDNTGNIVRFLLQRIPEHLRKQREPAEV